jgi:hypothetical protein
MGLYDDPTRTVIVFDTTDVADHVRKALIKSAKDLKKRFPEGNVLDSQDAALTFLAERLASSLFI